MTLRTEEVEPNEYLKERTSKCSNERLIAVELTV